MKKLLFLSILLVCGLSVNAQSYKIISYEFKNGIMILKRDGVAICKSDVNTTYFGNCYVNNICSYSDRNLTYQLCRLLYFPVNNRDTIIGYTRAQAIDLLNQAVNAKKGNFLGSYKVNGLFVPDTATIGNYYYDTDSALFRVRTEASGWQSLLPKY